MVGLNAQALARVQASEPPFRLRLDILVHRHRRQLGRVRARPWAANAVAVNTGAMRPPRSTEAARAMTTPAVTGRVSLRRLVSAGVLTSTDVGQTGRLAAVAPPAAFVRYFRPGVHRRPLCGPPPSARRWGSGCFAATPTCRGGSETGLQPGIEACVDRLLDRQAADRPDRRVRADSAGQRDLRPHGDSRNRWGEQSTLRMRRPALRAHAVEEALRFDGSVQVTATKPSRPWHPRTEPWSPAGPYSSG
jgi:hypothetical protein